jgi:hypothetical protein
LVATDIDHAPVPTPVEAARRTRRLTAFLLRRGLITFATLAVLIWPGGPIKHHEEVPDARDFPHQPEAPPPVVIGGGRGFLRR